MGEAGRVIGKGEGSVLWGSYTPWRHFHLESFQQFLASFLLAVVWILLLSSQRFMCQELGPEFLEKLIGEGPLRSEAQWGILESFKAVLLESLSVLVIASFSHPRVSAIM